jgi:acetylornithine deacetylase/succinyl-diaminopimelate desuccinylase-like protein
MPRPDQVPRLAASGLRAYGQIGWEAQVTESKGAAERRYVADNRERLISDLSEWVTIPSIAGVAEHEADVTRSANWLATTLREVGFPTVDLWRSGGTAAVFARWHQAPGAPTVLVYSHHDVRAVKPENWEQTTPFAPLLRGNRLFGRGTSDAKGQALAHLWAVKAHLAATGRAHPAVNLTFLIEGEEEAGSPQLAELLSEHPSELQCDLIVFSDTLQWHPDHPAVCTSVRGMIGASLEVHGALRDVHSGAASGPAPNPIMELSRLLANLVDERGRVTLPGFYDRVPELSPQRRSELAALPFSESDWLQRSQTRSIIGEDGYTVLERLWERPAVEIISIIGGDPTGMPRATIPSVATADVSIRIVPGQDPDEVGDQLEAWLSERANDDFEYQLDVQRESAQPPYRTPADLPALAALERSVAAGYGTDAVGRMGNAGSGPMHLLAESLGAPVIFFGTGLIEDYWHDSDESVNLDVLAGGAASLAVLWEELAG